MKPSEIINKMFLDNSYLDYIKNDADNLKLIKKQLDERFIDKKELEDNITKNINYIKNNKMYTIDEKNAIVYELENILKLLEE